MGRRTSPVMTVPVHPASRASALMMYFVLPLLLAGCTSLQPMAVHPDLVHSDGQVVRVSGVPVFDGANDNLLSLCPTSGDRPETGRCVDIVAPVGRKPILRTAGTRCMQDHGRLHAFTEGRIGLGNFRSEIGYIETNSVEYCRRH